MTDAPEWGPWIEHDGKGCPCVGEYVEARSHHGRFCAGIARGAVWHWHIVHGIPICDYGHEYDTVAKYRIRKPRGLTILEGLLENLPEMEGVE